MLHGRVEGDDEVWLEDIEGLAEAMVAHVGIHLAVHVVKAFRGVEKAAPEPAVLHHDVVRLVHLIDRPGHVLAPHVHAVYQVRVAIQLLKAGLQGLSARPMPASCGRPHQ
eukprot:scaffold99154_cov47-Prasinocladus_malaysianus.AAC.1